MKTVKEIADITGISIRTLHYYDEIGLLRPTAKTEAGYRYYDEKALEILQQVLYFRELDMPLKEIKSIVENPVLDKKQILESQRFALRQKKRRLERLISGIDSILKGEKEMDFEVFKQEDVEELYQIFVKNAPTEMLAAGVKEFGNLEAFHRNYVEKAYALYNKPETNQILMEAYGDKETLIEAAKNPPGQENVKQYQDEIDKVVKELVICKRSGQETDSLEIKMLVGKYALLTKKLYGLKNERELVLRIADTYMEHEKMREAFEQQYEEPGLAEYFVKAVREFYK